MYKTLAFTLRKQKTPWLPLSERVYQFLDIRRSTGYLWSSELPLKYYC